MTNDWDKTGSDIDWVEIIGMGLEENRWRTHSPIPEVVVADIGAAIQRICALDGVSDVREVGPLLCGRLNKGRTAGDWLILIHPACRFVWAVGAIREDYPDVPEWVVACEELVLWDRKRSRVVVSVAGDYAGIVGMEVADENQPLTDLGGWINRLTPEALASEGIPV